MGDFANFLTNYGLNRSVGVDQAALENQYDYQKQIRALGIQRDQAENDLIPEKQAAARARLGLSTVQDTAATPNAAKDAKLTGTVLDTGQTAAEDQQAQQQTFLSLQHDQLKTNANAAHTALAMSNTNLENLPNEILDQRQANLISDQTAGLKAAGGLGIAMASGDPQQALDFANNVAAARSKFDGKQRSKITTIIPDAPGPDGKPSGVVRMLDANGNPVAEIPHQTIHAGMNLLAPPKTTIIPRGGKIGVTSPLTGAFTETGDNPLPNRYNIKEGYLYDTLGKEPPKKLDLPGGVKPTALIANMKFLVETGVAKDHKDALDKLKTSSEKSPEEQILNLASTLMAKGSGYHGKDGAQKALADAQQMVRSLKAGSTTAPPTAARPATPAPTAQGATAAPAQQSAPAGRVPQGAVQSAPGLSPKAQQILRDLGVTN